jgi:nitrogen fixation/metabolism regulation signal transduction histidine kinase
METSHYSEAVPELAPLILRAMSEPVGRAGGEVTIKRSGNPRTLSVQVTSEKGSADGFVLTFDDITDLVSAQRTAAWADVARRIAHEIKNPLTPIQLSAERLKRKYASEIVTDPEVFQQCTDTIVRQVGDIGRMVDEFSSFARMPAPVMRRENAQELLQQAVFLQRVANPAITFSTATPKDPVHFEGDGRLISQALTNVLKNAGKASPRASPRAMTSRAASASPCSPMGPTSPIASPTMASACRRNTAIASPNPMSPPAPRAPAWGWRSCARSWKTMAGISAWATPKTGRVLKSP